MIIVPIIIMQGTEVCRGCIADILSTDLHARLQIKIFFSSYNFQSENWFITSTLFMCVSGSL
jgi:hypothetical protein